MERKKGFIERLSLRFNTSSRVGSLYQWMLTSFIVVSLPLIFAIFYALFALDSYSKQAGRTVFQTVTVTENARLVLERLISMERGIRQFQILNDPSFFEAYIKHRHKFIKLLDESSFEGLNTELLQKLKELKNDEERLFQIIYINGLSQNKKLSAFDLLGFETLVKKAKELIRQGSRQQTSDVLALSKFEAEVTNRLFFIVLLSAFLALLLSVFFVHFITRPIKKIGLAIKHLAKEDFDFPIEVFGPRDLKELGQNLEGLRKELKYLENEKQHFIRSVSHELKTPLATLKEGTDLLSEEMIGDLNGEQREVLNLMKMGNFNIISLVSNLLEYQRAVSIQSRLEYSQFDLSSLMTSLVGEYQLLFQSKNQTIILDVDSIKITADYNKIKIILSNFISNAIKFAGRSTKIGLSAKVENKKVQILIEDQGPGIPDAIKNEIFEDFYQGTVSDDSVMKGTGLGLAIVGYYVVKHGGRTILLPPNEQYCGARFVLELPLEAKNEA
ncbi:Sensor histidine kinase GlrK [hydrothermal vent metagenome]|uniref:histidine kinase n=1 Tax=hydrothermal vent metagenome TaxID=652676 RepID=A0A3B0W8Y4_9ZZZZ